MFLTTPSSADVRNDPVIAYREVRLDLGTFFNEFVVPIVGGVQKRLEPVKPVVDS